MMFVVPLALAFAVMQLSEIPPPGTPAEMWAPVATTFVWLIAVWDGEGRPPPRLGAHLLAQLALFEAVARLFGWGLADAVWMGVTATAAGFLMTVVFARVKESPTWQITEQRDNVRLFVVAFVCGVLVALLGGYPNLDIGQFDRLTAWWIIRDLVYTYIAGSTFLLLFYAERRHPTDPTPAWAVPVLVPAGAVCLWLTYLDPNLPVSWALLLPAITAGSVLAPRGAAIYSITVAVGAAVATLFPVNQFGYEGTLPGSVIIDLLLTACTFVTVHLALLRAQRVAVTAQLDEQRRSAEGQASLLSRVFESMTDGLVVFDQRLRVRMHNTAALRLIGRPIPIGEKVDWVEYLRLRRLDGTPLDLRTLAADDSHLRLELLLGDQDKVMQFGVWWLADEQRVVLFSDVTAEHERLNELIGFAGVVAHDLRSPLTTLQGWLELLEDALEHGRPDRAIDLAARARVSSTRMAQVIEDWLAYAVQREGTLGSERVPLAALIDQILLEYAGGEAPLDPEFVIACEHDVQGDPVLVKQLLDNLIGNAIKYAVPGERPWIHVRSSAAEKPGFVQVQVSDRGIGLPPGEENRVFEEFHRAAAHAATVNGTGLGLSLCRRIVNRHGGQIEAANNPEGGATFTFTLPAAVTRA
jgi:signal transduction histidine kinase